MVGINSNYSSNTYLNGMANVGKSAVVDAMNGKDAASIFSGFLDGSIDSLTNSIAESCSTDTGKNLTMVIGAAIKMLLAYVIGSAENDARDNTQNARNIANTGEQVNQGILEGSNEVIAHTNEEIAQYRTTAQGAMDAIMQNNDSAQEKINNFETQQNELAQTLSETQGKRDALGNERVSLIEKIHNLQSELNTEKPDDKSLKEQKKEEIQAKKEEIKAEKEKLREAKHQLKTFKKAYKNKEITKSEFDEMNSKYSAEIELHGVNIERLDGELKELKNANSTDDLDNAKQQELAHLQKQLAQVDARIIECDNTSNETIATMNGNHDSLVGYIESANQFNEERSGEFETALNNILQSTSTTEEKIGQITDQLENFNVKLEGVENQQLAEQLVNGTTDMTLGATAETTAAVEGVVPGGQGTATQTAAKGASLIKGGGMEFAGSLVTKAFTAAMNKNSIYTVGNMRASLGANINFGQSTFNELSSLYGQIPLHLDFPQTDLMGQIKSNPNGPDITDAVDTTDIVPEPDPFEENPVT